MDPRLPSREELQRRLDAARRGQIRAGIWTCLWTATAGGAAWTGAWGLVVPAAVAALAGVGGMLLERRTRRELAGLLDEPTRR